MTAPKSVVETQTCTMWLEKVGRKLEKVPMKYIDVPRKPVGASFTHQFNLGNVRWVCGEVLDVNRTSLPHTYTIKPSVGGIEKGVTSREIRTKLRPGQHVWHELGVYTTVVKVLPGGQSLELENGSVVARSELTIAHAVDELVELSDEACSLAKVVSLAPGLWKVMAVHPAGPQRMGSYEVCPAGDCCTASPFTGTFGVGADQILSTFKKVIDLFHPFISSVDVKGLWLWLWLRDVLNPERQP